jgi:hypothetical protein
VRRFALFEKYGIEKRAEDIRIDGLREMAIKARGSRPLLVGGLSPSCKRNKVRGFSP